MDLSYRKTDSDLILRGGSLRQHLIGTNYSERLWDHTQSSVCKALIWIPTANKVGFNGLFQLYVSFVKLCLLPALLATNRINVAKISFQQKKTPHQMEYSFFYKIQVEIHSMYQK